MKLAITGGGGFLGYHLCNNLADKFDEILVLDIAGIDYKEYPPNIKYFNIDIRNQNKLNSIFEDVDVVIHAAAALPLWEK
ncbi:MAG: NAD(P)-dependent oxidoreductase, partial [Candidatus Omnitrophota bacterium]